jgi:hypothetical protein
MRRPLERLTGLLEKHYGVPPKGEEILSMFSF